MHPFIEKHKDALVLTGTLVVLAGAGLTYYHIKKKRLQKAAKDDAGHMRTISQTISKGLGKRGTSTRSARPVLTQRGSRGESVKVLQRYLKIYKADLGHTGPNKDGVDGIFGPKTEKAAQHWLKKTAFTTQDIAGMRKALTSLGK
jgi:peptidoglycan hydrolase-like protein with peptidoglycan-binding domain